MQAMAAPSDQQTGKLKIERARDVANNVVRERPGVDNSYGLWFVLQHVQVRAEHVRIWYGSQCAAVVRCVKQ